MGVASKVVMIRDNTTIVDGNGSKDSVLARVEIKLKRKLQIQQVIMIEKITRERLAKLSGGVAVIEVGAATETEMKEKKIELMML